ncbi:MAG: hypothetical protein AMJ90_07360 [candidate division Zixibacteria bacterium SM23_73_2]|nr:MAG: hypothetical protein AMJ90_07360 [candidate division Zixibacteria bacterium SM23_73_2]
MHKILIIQTAFLGDVILTTPLVKATRKLFPDAKISFLLIPQTKEVFSDNPYLDEIIVYDKKGEEKKSKDFLHLLKKLRQRNFDLALFPHRSLRSALLAYLSKIPRRIGFDKSDGSIFFTEKIKYNSSIHEIERNLTLLKPLILKPLNIEPLNIKQLNFEIPNLSPELYPSDEDILFVRRFLKDSKVDEKEKIIAIAPGSVWETKRWLAQRFAQVADLLIEKEKAKIILVGGAEDKQLCQEISAMMKKRPVIAAGKTTVLQSAVIISKSKVLLSNDSAPVHIASATKTPTVAIFGSTIPYFGFGPYGNDHTIIQKKLPCRPCGIHGKRKCPEKHFKCMKDITTEEVFQAVSELIKG